MQRRRFLTIAGLGVALLADDDRDVVEALTTAAQGLSEGNADEFLKPFDKDMPAYGRIAADVYALTSQNEIVCSIDIVTQQGDNRHRSADLDWFMQIRARAADGAIQRRRERVKVRFEKRGKKWRIISFEPVSVLSPVEVR